MFKKFFSRNHPVVSEKYKIEPDEMFLQWLHQMRNPSTDDVLPSYIVKPDPPIAQPSTR